TQLANRLNPPFNLVISNVPGPQVPLYSGGAEMLHFYPVSAVADTQGLNITVQSYNGKLDFGLVACRDLVPDLWDLCRMLPDALVDTDPARLADAEAVIAIHRQLQRLEAVATRASSAFEAAGTWTPDGARSAAAWLATRCRLPLSTARRRLRLGRALRHMARAEAAWLAGDIDAARVGALADART